MSPRCLDVLSAASLNNSGEFFLLEFSQRRSVGAALQCIFELRQETSKV